jgi:hypothetical protein
MTPTTAASAPTTISIFNGTDAFLTGTKILQLG